MDGAFGDSTAPFPMATTMISLLTGVMATQPMSMPSTTPDARHSYATADTYTVTIKGTVEAWSFFRHPESKNRLVAVTKLRASWLEELLRGLHGVRQPNDGQWRRHKCGDRHELHVSPDSAGSARY